MPVALAHLARQLGGDVVGHQVLAPGPRHSRKDRSLSVRLSTASDDGFVVYSHAGDDFAECRDHVRALIGLAQWQPERRRETLYNVQDKSAPPDLVDNIHEVQDDAAKIARAVAIWDEAGDPVNTVVERYLASRGLALPWQAVGEAIRYHPACPWRDEASGRTIRVPAMVCAMRNLFTEEIIGIHRTRLTPDGVKVDRRMLGKASGAAVMLCPMSAVGAGLVLGEGVETCLAAWQLGWANVWAACSVGAIERLPLLPALQSLVLLAEGDATGANTRAIEAVGNRWTKAGREVLILAPSSGTGDINDAIRGGAA